MNDRQNFLDELSKIWITWIEKKEVNCLQVKKDFIFKKTRYLLVAYFIWDEFVLGEVYVIQNSTKLIIKVDSTVDEFIKAVKIITKK